MRHIPNLLTIARIIIIPPFVILFFYHAPIAHWIAFWIYFVICVTDFFDGYLARRWKTQSNIGIILDPIADKIFIMSTLVALMFRDHAISSYIFIPTLIILAREILVSGLREFLSNNNGNLKVTYIAKWKTTIQFIALGTLIVGNALPFIELTGLILLWLAATLTVVTGIDYCRKAWQYI